MQLSTSLVLAHSLLLTTLSLCAGLGESDQLSVGHSLAEGGRGVAQRSFREIPGVQEFSSRMIVRPLQRLESRERAVSAEQAAVTAAAARHLLSSYELVDYVPQTDESIILVPAGSSEDAVAEELLATGYFQYVEPDWLLYPDAVTQPPQVVAQRAQPGSSAGRQLVSTCPDDPQFTSQWHHAADRLRSCFAWTLESGTPQVSVGVCDTGILTTHEDLHTFRLEGYNAVDRLWESEGGDIGPRHYHGTRTTGVVAAEGNNGLGVVGVGWNLSHRMIRVSNAYDGTAFLSDLQHGARTSIESGDRIASVSYHGASSLSNLTTAAYIRSIGGLLLWGAGNTSSNYSYSDRDDDDLIVVGATDQSDLLATFSSYGTFIDLVAPGVGITTTGSSFNSDYATADGTSYSCPMAAGVCAMIWSRRPDLSPGDVEAILKATCVDIGAVGIDNTFGYGRIDLLAALEASGRAVPSADFAAPILTGIGPLTVEFRDLSTGVPTSWAWDFGDGAVSSEQNPVHTYTTSGAFTVSLTASNALGTDVSTVLDYVLVDVIPPVSNFDATPTGGLAPMLVQFTDLSTGGLPTSWLWDFGDGATSTEQSPVHTYNSSGIYSVNLTVTNPYGFDSLQKSSYIAVDFIPPIAAFSATPTTGNSPYVVQFSDESTGGVATSWLWSFGNGSSSTAQNPAFTYTAPGTYSVRLTVSNAYGTDELLKLDYINVGPGPPILSDFIGTPLTGTAPLQVDFTELSLGNVTSWSWQFDDGTTSVLPNPTHTFTTPGEYNIALQVADAFGNDHAVEKEVYIVVQ